MDAHLAAMADRWESRPGETPDQYLARVRAYVYPKLPREGR